jgi:hypothetical protein
LRIHVRTYGALVTLVALGAGLAGGVGAHGASDAVSSTLNAGFDADGNIYLTFADGTKIGNPTPPGTLVPAGSYTIDLYNNSLDDLGNPHSFHLSGPGVNLAANGTVQATWTATFQASSDYSFYDDDNPSSKFFFGTAGSGATSTVPTVSTTSTPPPTTTATTPKATNNSPLASGTKSVASASTYRGILDARVEQGRVTLTRNGKAVAEVLQGRYRIVVTDTSRTGGFTIQETGRPSTTVSGVTFVGKRSATLELTAGQWFFYPTFVGHKTYFIVER